MTSQPNKSRIYREKKKPMALKADDTEYKRVKYSLKMAMGLINAEMNGIEIEQYNQKSFNFQAGAEKTTVECWVRADSKYNSHQQQKIE